MKKMLVLISAIVLSPAMPVAAHEQLAYPFIAPVAVPVAAPVQMTVPIYQDVATLETFEELRILLSNPDRLHQLANDPIARQFLRERLTAREVAVSAGVSQEYLNWLYESLIVPGNRIDPAVINHNFRLLPAQHVATWPQIQTRLYPGGVVLPATTAGWTARATTQHGHAHVHHTPNAHAKVIARVPTGSTATILSESGDWYQVQFGGVVGYGHKYELTPESQYAVSCAPSATYSAGSIVAWKPEGGYDTPYGWVYPRSTQTIQRIR